MRALIHSAEQAHCSSDLLQAVEAINRRQKHKLFERIRVFYDGDLRGKTFALWGLAFKPNTDDMRDAPSRELMEAFLAARRCAPTIPKQCRKPSGSMATTNA